MAMVPLQPRPGSISSGAVQDAWKKVIPGQRYLAWYEGSDDVWHEQVAGWACGASRASWIIHSTDGDKYEQDMLGGSMVSHIIVLSLDGSRPYLEDDIYAISEPIGDEQMLDLVRASRAQAKALYGAAVSESMFATFCSWDGEILPIPDVAAPTRRLRAKGPAVAALPAGTPVRGDALARPAIGARRAAPHQAPVFHLEDSPGGHAAAEGGLLPPEAPGLRMDLEPKDGHVWLISTIGHSRHKFGSEVHLAPGALVHGNCGIWIDSTGAGIAV